MENKDKVIRHIQRIIRDKVNPKLEEHLGGCELAELTDDGYVFVRLIGECVQCPAADITVQDVIKKFIMDNVPEVKDVELDNRIDENTMDFINQILEENRKKREAKAAAEKAAEEK